MKIETKINDCKIQLILILTSHKNMQWQYIHITCALNVKIHILEDKKIVKI